MTDRKSPPEWFAKAIAAAQAIDKARRARRVNEAFMSGQVFFADDMCDPALTAEMLSYSPVPSYQPKHLRALETNTAPRFYDLQALKQQTEHKRNLFHTPSCPGIRITCDPAKILHDEVFMSYGVCLGECLIGTVRTMHVTETKEQKIAKGFDETTDI